VTDAIPILSNLAGQTASSLAIVASAITLAIILLAATLPRVLNSIRSDRLEGNVLKRLQDLETKSVAQDAKIHRYAVRVTKLTVLVLRLQALLVNNKIDLPQDIIDEIVELIKETEDDTP
jgi:hypothetical protein